MNSNVKTLVFWVVLVCVGVLVWAVIQAGGGKREETLTFTQFINDVEAGRVKSVSISGTDVKGVFRDDQSKVLRTVVPREYQSFYDTLRAHNVNVEYKDASGGSWVSLLVNAIPFILLIGFWIFMMRQMQSGGNKALSFGKSRARLLSSQQKKVTFKDVAGVDEAKEELQEIIEFLREPQKFQKLGGRIPKGVLLVGPPGTGKTLLARAIAGEANVPFFSISGSDFVEMFVGVGASRVRDLFEQGKKNAPCIIFIDEIDAVGRHRGAGLGGGHDEREQTLNQLLVEMDGFESNEGVILVAATNRPDVLDPALLRPGRFDRRVVVAAPRRQGPRADSQASTRARSRSPTTSNLQRHRARHAGFRRRRPRQPGQRSGPDRRPPESQGRHHGRLRAGQGQGHDGRRAQVHDPHRRGKAKHRLSRGRPRAGRRHDSRRRPAAQGHHHPARHGARPHHAVARSTTSTPTRSDYLEAQLAILMAGRIAEEIFLNHITTGAGNDIERATDAGPQDGLRVGHERSRPAQLRQEGRADLPRPRNRPAPRLLRRHRASRSTSKSASSSTKATASPKASSKTIATPSCASPKHCSNAKSSTAPK